ncbi:eliciting plant response-like protein [Echria macrotheca]|uniref:Eliciting plant response-like protein n=1 Tax=Echria macrotheca TaxID=438768 RepID=A0AAJ0BHI0_9PEZI|nr:eliciting plant response-like protein [Echria macrotheca]
MLLTTALTTLLTLATTSLATTVSFDPGYDEPSRPISVLACSDGVNGLTTRFGWHSQDDIPSFPHIGGAEAVAGWNSPACGTCWSATYHGKTIYVLAVDHTDAGLNVGHEAMEELTGGNADMLGRIEADVALVDGGYCGLH